MRVTIRVHLAARRGCRPGAGPSGLVSWVTGEGGLRVALTLCALPARQNGSGVLPQGADDG
jgi:hypothetical protein